MAIELTAPATPPAAEVRRVGAVEVDRVSRRSIVSAVSERQVDADARTVELVFSSEAPVARWWGQETLGHDAGEADLTRIEAGVAPLLVNHDPDQQVGRVVSARIDTAARVGRATVQFGRSALAEEIFADVVDGIRQAVSVGYSVDELRLEAEVDGEPEYRVVAWSVFEISIVSMPADPGVGVGRSEAMERREVPVSRTSTTTEKEGREMADENNQAGAATAPATTTTAQASAPAVSADRAGAEARAARSREVEAILALGERAGMATEAREAVRADRSLAEFERAVLEHMVRTNQAVAPASVDLTAREQQRYSVVNVIRSMAFPHAGVDISFEREVGRAFAQAHGVDEVRGVMVPHSMLLARDLVAVEGTGAEGSQLVGTTHRADLFIDALRARLLVGQMGAVMLDGLVGNVDIPKLVAGATVAWQATEQATATASTPNLDQVSLSPKQAIARVNYTRRLLAQSAPSVEAMVRNDLMASFATAIDLAAIAGSGASGQPTGILSMTGVGSVAVGTNGGALAWSHVVDLEKEVAVDNADMGTLGYLTNPKVRGAAKQTEKATGTAQFIMGSGRMADGFDELNGYRAGITTQVPSNLTKGTGTALSALIFGNFADLMIGMWGGLDLVVDPYTGGDTGTIITRGYQMVDVAARHEESFATCEDIDAS